MLRSLMSWLTPIIFGVVFSGISIGQCVLTLQSASPSCNMDGTYDLDVCFTHSPHHVPLVNIDAGNGAATMDLFSTDGSLQCVTLTGLPNNDGVLATSLKIEEYPVFISELHYDNASTDTDEGVEVSGPSGTDLTGWTIALYDGADGEVYSTIALSGTIDDEDSGCGALTFSEAGIQNGPDGLALVDPSNNVVHFISYEGSFIAMDGPANTMTSIDIGVSETSSTPVGYSLQLTDEGWQSAGPNSFGSLNTGLSCTCEYNSTIDVSIMPPMLPANIGFCEEAQTLLDPSLYFDEPLSVEYGFEDIISGTVSSDLVTLSNAVFGPGVSSVSFVTDNTDGMAYSATGWSTDVSLDEDDYLEICLSVPYGKAIKIDNLSFEERRSGTGPRAMEVHYSVDGFNTPGTLVPETDQAIDDNESWRSWSFDVDLLVEESLCIRIYGFNAESSAGRWRFDDLALTGSVEISPTINYNFYNGFPTMAGNLVAEGVQTYDPGLNLNTAPQTYWVRATDGSCESIAVEVTVHVQEEDGTLACSEMVQISTHSGCTLEVTSEHVMKGQPIYVYEIEVFDEDGNSLGNMVGPENFGRILTYRIYDACASNSCWGKLIVEDKIAPEVICELDGIYLGAIEKQDLEWVKQIINEYADGLVCITYDEESGECIEYEEVETIPFQNHNLNLEEPFTSLYLNEFCLTDNCQDHFDIDWRLYPASSLNGNENVCADPGEVYDTYVLQYYFIWEDPHEGLVEEVIATYEFDVIRPEFPAFPHDVTVYCVFGNDRTPEGIARQKNNLHDCGTVYDCKHGEEGDICHDGIPYGWPFWETHDGCYIALQPNDLHGYCKYFASYSDEVLLSGCCQYKILRHWTIVDWCSAETLVDYQVVERRDINPPKLKGEKPYSLEVGIKPWLCYAYVTIPDNEHKNLKAIDACCDAGINVSIHYYTGAFIPGTAPFDITEVAGKENICDSYGSSLGKDYEKLNIGDQITLEEGLYVIKYQAVDECGNEGEYVCTMLWVLDNTPPVPVCKDEIIVSLTPDNGVINGGTAKITSESLDLGSHDSGCGPVYFKIIRMDELYGTDHGYWNDFGPEKGPDYTRPPQQKLFPPAICKGVNGDDFPDVVRRNEKGNLEFLITFRQFFFDDEIKFCCEDQGEQVPVILRVFDVDPGEGPVDPRRMEDMNYGGIPGYDEQENDLSGHFNDCMVIVTVQNKIDATILCGKDMAVYCDYYPDTPGEAYLHAPSVDALCGDVELNYEDIVELNDCQFGVVYRLWEATSNGEVVASCTQHIYVGAKDVFDPRTIKWPPHQTGEEIWARQIECVEGEDHPKYIEDVRAVLPPHLDCMEATTCVPEWDDTSCGLIGWSLESDTVYFEDESCIKIINNWTVIDWCVWEPNCDDDYADTDDNWAWIEDWSLGECAKPGCYNDGVYNLYGKFIADCTIHYGFNSENSDDCEHRNFGYYLDCTECCGDGAHGEEDIVVDGYYVWQQTIKVINTSPPVLGACTDKIINAEADCMGRIVLQNSATDSEDCGVNWLKWYVELFDVHWNPIDYWDFYSSNGETVEINAATEDGWDEDDAAEGIQPPGTYIVRWNVTDGCNNEATCIQYINIVDNKPPTPICHGVLSTALMQSSGQVEVWATDFEQKSFDNCTPDNELEYGIKHIFSELDPAPSFVVTCPMMNTNPIQLQMFVTDEEGNSDWCYVQLFVSDDSGYCDDNTNFVGIIGGQIITENGEPVEKATVRLNGNTSDYPKFHTTSGNGQFQFENNPRTDNYSLSVRRNDTPMNGISTIDLLLMQRHILDQVKLNSPYKVIAADINSDESVSAIDMYELRQLILGMISNFSNNESWRFVDAEQDMNLQNPFPFMERINIDNLPVDRLNEDFIGIKIGDVSGDVRAHGLEEPEVRSREVLEFVLQDELLDKSEMIDIEFYGEDDFDIRGFQFTMDHPGLEWISAESGNLQVTQHNFGIHENQMTASWNHHVGSELKGSLFTLRFRAKKAVKLSQSLRIHSGITRAEAYLGSNYEKHEPVLVFRTGEEVFENTQFELYQNEPNPFDSETSISFTLPKDNSGVISILDVTGRTVKVIRGNYKKGINRISLDSEELGEASVYYYKLESGGNVAVKKMVLIR